MTRPLVDCSAHLNGFALWLTVAEGDELAAIFPTLTDAARAMTAAGEAMDALDRIFAAGRRVGA